VALKKRVKSNLIFINTKNNLIMKAREALLLGDTLYDSDKLVVDHITNEKGEILEQIWENLAYMKSSTTRAFLSKEIVRRENRNKLTISSMPISNYSKKSITTLHCCMMMSSHLDKTLSGLSRVLKTKSSKHKELSFWATGP
jgi:hypothetical protein